MKKDPTIETYNKYAAVYDREVIEFWDNFPTAFIDKFAAELPGKRILNLGSGSGRDAMLLHDRGLEVVCVDASSAMVKMTTQLGFESHQSTFADLDYPDNSFDGVWAYTSLIHIPKSEAEVTLKSIYRMLKVGGAFAIGAIEGETASMVERRTMPGSARYFKMYKKDELQELIENCGLKFIHQQDYRPHNNVYINQLYRKDA